MGAMEEYLAGYSKDWWEEAKRNRILVREYNTIDPTDLEGKYRILQELLGAVSRVTVIEPPFYCDNGKNIFLGHNFYANYNFVVLDAAKITIGDNAVVGPNVTIVAADHPIHPESRTNGESFPITCAPVEIGDDVWIGAGVTILKGVKIGKGSVIGAHSLVTRDIPPMVVAAGTPCRVLRAITEEDRFSWEE